MTERELLEKLLDKSHLSVPERKQLPNGKAKASILVEIILEAVEKSGVYPYAIKDPNSFGEGCSLTKEGSEFILTKSSEISLETFDIVFRGKFTSGIEAARKFLELNYDSPDYAGTIDGVPIDWKN